jgi:hypothetical protein
MLNDREEKLKQAAKLYTKREGEALLAEVEEIRRQNVFYLTPRADKAVAGLVSKSKRPMRQKMLFGVCAAAACIMIVARVVVGLPDTTSAPSLDTSSAPSQETSPAPSQDTTPAPAPYPAVPTEQAEILPISFALPADYRVAETDFDNGVSIYSLESDDHGNVVLTMYYEVDTAGAPETVFDEVIIDGTPVSAKVTDSYMLLAFESDGLSYTLSSRDDLGSLAAFYRNITEAVPV